MGKLSYGMIASLDGYISGPDGRFDWGVPDEEVHRFVNQRERSIGTYLYGRRMYEVMSWWETDEAVEGNPEYEREYAAIWRAADKVVYSATLAEPVTGRTRLERRFEADAVRALKDASSTELTVSGPDLAGQMLRAGLVDELGLYVAPVVVGGGVRYLPDGLHIDVDLAEERRFSSGFVFLRYLVRR